MGFGGEGGRYDGGDAHVYDLCVMVSVKGQVKRRAGGERRRDVSGVGTHLFIEGNAVVENEVEDPVEHQI